MALVVTALLPYAGRIGGPVYGLFPIALAVFVTALDASRLEQWVASLGTRAIALGLVALLGVVVLLRAGVPLPTISGVARPLLAERERTCQLEHALAWLRSSKYCAHELAFSEASGSPIESVESAMVRRHRPPSALEDVLPFWNVAVKCAVNEHAGRFAGVVTVTFGGQAASGTKVLELPGSYAGPAMVWARSH